jgi:hypothetical protein
MRGLAILFLLAISSLTQAQLTVDTTITAQSMVEDFLLGSGVLVSNVQMAGNDNQNGIFMNGMPVLQLDSGIVLSSAFASNVADGGFGDNFGNGVSSPYLNDLLDIANSVPPLIGQNFSIFAMYDASILEFDFVPYGDSLTFTYVFGSDEYLEWVNTSFNDAFAFFVSGPGIEGPYTDGAVNIAYVPESDPQLPITVSSVNNLINSDYYIYNLNNEGVYIDGYTQPIEAHISGLEIGSTYHIALVIADGSDSAFESIVMLQAGSFSANAPAEPGEPGDFNGDGQFDVNDLLILIANYGCEGEECIGDINEDGLTNILDILIFLGLFN